MSMSRDLTTRANAMEAHRGLRLFAVIVGALLLGAGDARAENASAQALHVNPQRLQATLEKLSEFGRNPEGGVTRLGFSQADLDARAYVTSLMTDAGLEVRVDPAGNIFGRRAGSEQLPTLLFGSHIDSVPHGGNFDGPLGSLGAIEVIRALMTRSSPRATRSRW
jgi:beta-ureidopropionase / N-carbamoyl-L-amino-acid hydrolase